MAAFISHQVIIVFLLFYSQFLNFVNLLTIISPSDGSIFNSGSPIPVNVMNSAMDTATVFTATFVSSMGTYQVAALALSYTYMLIPAGLHGPANLVITAAGATTAVITIQITPPIPPAPSPPCPIYTPTNTCGKPPANFPCYPYPTFEPPQCPRPCFHPTSNIHCDSPFNGGGGGGQRPSWCEQESSRSHFEFYSPIKNRRHAFRRNLLRPPANIPRFKQQPLSPAPKRNIKTKEVFLGVKSKSPRSYCPKKIQNKVR